MTGLRSLPAVDKLLRMSRANEMIVSYGRPLTLEAIRSSLDEAREAYSNGGSIPGLENILDRAESLLDAWTASTLSPVINATGVILHTNLGRAPLSRSAMLAIGMVGRDYSTLEYDLDKGQRGSRTIHAEALICRLTGSEAAMVVNNNASAILLVLTALARRRAVLIARSQLVEIGGGFRIPDVMKLSGARLVEVGTTNRVHLDDYEQALEQSPALILRAHRSNFRITGFTSEPSLADLSVIARRVAISLVDDLGSGSLLETERFGMAHEPMVQESLLAGADLVCFSGDKLLGGPQAGIIAGRADLLARLKKHPMARAVRADKLCLAGLSATLLHYLKDEALQEIPIWQMIAAPASSIQGRAQAWQEAIGHGQVIPGESTVGGGSLPGETLPTFLLALRTPNPDRFLARLRLAQPPIIARLEEGQVLFDPRTILLDQEQDLLENLTHFLKG